MRKEERGIKQGMEEQRKEEKKKGNKRTKKVFTSFCCCLASMEHMLRHRHLELGLSCSMGNSKLPCPVARTPLDRPLLRHR